jgi:hypothetical protein
MILALWCAGKFCTDPCPAFENDDDEEEGDEAKSKQLDEHQRDQIIKLGREKGELARELAALRAME